MQNNQVLVDQKEFTTRKMLRGLSLTKLFTAQVSLQSQIVDMLCESKSYWPIPIFQEYEETFDSGLFKRPHMPAIKSTTADAIYKALVNTFPGDDYKRRFQHSTKAQRNQFRNLCCSVIRNFLTQLIDRFFCTSNPDFFNITIIGKARVRFFNAVEQGFKRAADQAFGPSLGQCQDLEEKKRQPSTGRPKTSI